MKERNNNLICDNFEDIVNQLSSSVGLLDSGATKTPKDFVGLLYSKI